MKIYNEDKTKVLKEEKLDLEKGHLESDVIITHVPAKKGVPEEGHYEVIKEYDNGGKDVKWVVDKEGIPDIEEHDEYEDIQVYIPYTKEELNQQKIDKLTTEMETVKKTLSDSDYKVLKHIEGYYTEEEFEEIKSYRENLREQIRELELEINNLSNS